MSKAHHLRGFNEVLTLAFSSFLFFTILVPTSLLAQETSQLSIINLKKATVFFVLPTAFTKISVLRDRASAAQNQSEKEHLLKLIDREKMEADSFSKALQHAVQQHYTFSAYAYIPDSALKQMVNQSEETSTPIFIVRRTTTESGADAPGTT
ncbi:MAG: hypothetical protein IPL46_07375 [Saprospiraceae bacterium]|nr:hypothetical protein [Saprospiraceae bacterium]